jgi:hypothetical protein
MTAWSYLGPVKSGEGMSLFYRVGAAQWVYAACHSGIGFLYGSEQAWRSIRERVRPFSVSFEENVVLRIIIYWSQEIGSP